MLAARVSLAILRGDLNAAEEHADRALRIQALSGYLWAAGLFLPALALARLDRGDAEGAKAALARWDETADDLGRITTSLLRTLVAVRCGEAGREALPQMPRMPSQPLLGAQDWAILSIEIARELHDPALAAKATDLLEATIGRGMIVSSSLPVLLSRAAAMGHALLGRGAYARRRFADAIQFADDHGAHAEGARARLGLAQLEADRDPAVALVMLRQALPVLERLAAGPILTEAGQLAERLGMGAGRPEAGAEPIADQASVLFLDVVDSTRLTEEWGDVEYRNKARSLERRLRLTIAEHGGAVMPGINLGDGLVALFRSSDKAVHAGLAAVRASQGDVLRLHVGVHHGSVLRERDAVYGSAVNIASRVCAISSPDEVLVSAASHGLLTKQDVPGIAFVDRGSQRLKGFAEPQRVFAVVPA